MFIAAIRADAAYPSRPRSYTALTRSSRRTNMTELSFDVLRREHADVRRLIARLRLSEAELASGDVVGGARALVDVLRDLERRSFRDMRREEEDVYPLLARALGSKVPVLALLAEHRSIRDAVADLARMLKGGTNVTYERALRLGVINLAEELELHLRREEAAFGALGVMRAVA